MKAYKLILSFSVIIFAIVGIFWTLGFIQQDAIMDVSGKSITIVLILGISSLVLYKVLGVSDSDTKDSVSSSNSNQQGPKF